MKLVILSLLASVLLLSCSDRGKKISKGYLEVYYKEGITKEQAEKTMDYFLPLWKDEGEKTKTKSIQLSKNGDTIHFRMVAKMEVIEKMDKDIFYTMANEISKDLFNNAPVNVVLTDNTFKTLRTYTFKKMATQNFGEKVVAGNVEVYMMDGINTNEATELAEYLNTYMAPENRISFQLGRNADDILLRMASTPESAADIQDSDFYTVAKNVSDKMYFGRPLVFEITDLQFNPFKKIEYKTAADVNAE